MGSVTRQLTELPPVLTAPSQEKAFTRVVLPQQSLVVCQRPQNTVILFLMVHECKRFACHLTAPLTCS